MTNLDISLYGNQYRFVCDSCHYAALIGGIGSGKSLGGAARALLAGLGEVGGQAVPVPNLGMVTAPTYTLLRDATLRTFKEIAADLIDMKNSAFAAPAHVRLLNGSEVLFRSADNPEMLRGPNISWWWGDEAALYHGNVWKIMIGRLRQFGRHGYAWVTSTPKGRNWIYKLFAGDKPLGDSVCYRLTTRTNPFLDDGFVRSLEENYIGDYARQELDGEFIGYQGLVYPEFDRERHMIGNSDLPREFKQVKAGVDWGMVNPGVIQVVAEDADGCLYLVHEEYQRGRGIADWVEVARQLRDIWRINEFACDPAEPDNIAKFNEKGLKARAADNTVSTGIQMVKRRLAIRTDGRPGLVCVPSTVNTFAEFEQYEWASKGESLLDQPIKANDHALDALRYAVMAYDYRKVRPLSAEARRLL